MSTGQRTITSLLAVIAVVLVISITGSVSHQEAKAQVFEPLSRPVIQVAFSAAHNSDAPAFRLWQNGVIEWGQIGNIIECGSHDFICGWQVIPDPFPPPFNVRIVEIRARVGRSLWRVLSDGTVEQNSIQTTGEDPCDDVEWCGWVAIPE